MKTNVNFTIAICMLTALFFINCTGKKQKQSTQEEQKSTIDSVWTTEYQGKLPCADCSGINVTLLLSWSKAEGVNNTFMLKEEYIDRGTINTEGKFNVERGFENDNDATVIILNYDKSEREHRYYMWYSNDNKILHALSPKKELVKDTTLNYTLRRIEK